MKGIEFVWPDIDLPHPRLDELSIKRKLPKSYVRQSASSGHLRNAIWGSAGELSLQRHMNAASGLEFDCISFYSDDPKVNAYCARYDDTYFAIMGMPFVRRLVKICSLLRPALDARPKTSQPNVPRVDVERNVELSRLLEGEATVTEEEADRIVGSWPSADTDSGQIELDEFALFYDLIRLIWIHEWAHALCGHVALASRELGLAELYEFSTNRVDGGSRSNRNLALQGLELHADEFATRYCVHALLWGDDPVAWIAGPSVELVDRLLIFNVACCTFAVIWALAERKYAPDDTFLPPLPTVGSNSHEPLFIPTKSTHPPATLRYLRFRDFQREICMQYEKPLLAPQVDAFSFLFIETLSQASAHFYPLSFVTPLVIKTQMMKRLVAYETHLLNLNQGLFALLEEINFKPTVDPTSPET